MATIPRFTCVLGCGTPHRFRRRGFLPDASTGRVEIIQLGVQRRPVCQLDRSGVLPERLIVRQPHAALKLAVCSQN